jgi:flagellar biosynthesis protein FlhA
MRKMIASLNAEIEKLANMGYPPIVLTSPAARLYFRKLIARSVSGVTIVSHAEINQSVEIQILGVVRL